MTLNGRTRVRDYNGRMHRRHTGWISLLLFVLIWVSYRGIVHNSLLAEDFWQSQLWRFPNWWIKFATLPGGGGYRPWMFVGWAVFSRLWDSQPFPYRILTLWGHLLNASLVFTLTRRLSGRLSGAVLASALFVVWPMSAETVNWLSAASNQILCVFGYLWGLLCVIPLLTTGAFSRKWLALTGLGLVAALGSNEIGLTWPLAAVLVGLMLAAPRGSIRWVWSRRGRVWPLVVGWVAFLIWRTIAVRGLGGYGAAIHLRGGIWLWEAAKLYGGYVVDPVLQVLGNWTSWAGEGFGPAFAGLTSIVQGLGIGLSALAGGWALWRCRYAAALTAVFLIPAWTIPAPHRAYLAGAGLALAVATFWSESRRYLPGTWTPLLAHGLWLALTVMSVGVEMRATLSRNADWVAAGDWVRQVLQNTAELEPAPAEGTVFYYYDLPQYRGTVYTFTWGLAQAVQQHYREYSLKAYQVYATASVARIQANLERSLGQVANTAGPPQVYLVYQPGEAGHWLRRVSREEFLRLSNPVSP